MCLAVIAVDAHPRYALVLAANRDEFHARPSEPAHWWTDADGGPMLAGRDLAQGGTWLGVAGDGRYAFVTNVREPARFDREAPSRGMLVPALLRDPRGVREALAATVGAAHAYNGFNLVAGDAEVAAFASNRGPSALPLERGIHGVSNAGLDTPWPKVVRAKAGLAAWAASGANAIDPLWSVLADPVPAPDDQLPDTGVSRARERLLSSPFIISEDYGTRCSPLVALSRDGEAQFVERRFDAKGATSGEVAFRFRLDQSPRSITRCAMPASSKTPPLATKPWRS